MSDHQEAVCTTGGCAWMGLRVCMCGQGLDAIYVAQRRVLCLGVARSGRVPWLHMAQRGDHSALIYLFGAIHVEAPDGWAGPIFLG